jgi:hypothetical protein
MNVGSGRCKKFKKSIIITINVKNTKNEWW